MVVLYWQSGREGRSGRTVTTVVALATGHGADVAGSPLTI